MLSMREDSERVIKWTAIDFNCTFYFGIWILIAYFLFFVFTWRLHIGDEHYIFSFEKLGFTTLDLMILKSIFLLLLLKLLYLHIGISSIGDCFSAYWVFWFTYLHWIGSVFPWLSSVTWIMVVDSGDIGKEIVLGKVDWKWDVWNWCWFRFILKEWRWKWNMDTGLQEEMLVES